jgi:hypothetical protein
MKRTITAIGLYRKSIATSQDILLAEANRLQASDFRLPSGIPRIRRDHAVATHPSGFSRFPIPGSVFPDYLIIIPPVASRVVPVM